MPNAITHCMGTGLAVGLATVKLESDKGEISFLPVLNAALGASLGTLPDIIEPAFNSNHRQFFIVLQY
jgi:hypothetical protein